MRMFKGTLVEKMRKARDMSRPGLLRKISKVADRYKDEGVPELKASKQYLDRILNGQVKVLGSLYVGVLADVLECKVDDFFMTKPEKG